jgi:hypothetical protein
MKSRQSKFPEWKNGELQLTLILGLCYMLDLYCYLGVKFVDPLFKITNAGSHFKGLEYHEIGGMAVSLLLVTLGVRFGVWDKVFSNMVNAVHALVVLQVVICVFTVLLYDKVNLGWLRFAEGVVLSVGLGVSLFILSSYIGRRKRTWAGTIIFMMGFCGPLLGAILGSFGLGKGWFTLLPLAVWCCIFFWGGRWLVNFTSEFNDNSRSNVSLKLSVKTVDILKSTRFWRVFLTLFVSAVSVQFSVRLVINRPDFYDITVGKDLIYLARYTGCIVAFPLYAAWSIYRKSRRSSLVLGNVIGLIAFCFFYYNEAKDSEIHVSAFAFFLGISNAIWSVVMLSTLEVFGRRIQFWVIFAMPIFSRIIWDLPISLLKDANIQPFVFLLGLFVFGLGIVFPLFMQNNFEGGNNLQAYDDNFSKDYKTAILNQKTREKLGSISLEVKKGTTIAFLKEVQMAIKDRLLQVFDTSLYYFDMNFETSKQNVAVTGVVLFDDAYRDLTMVDAESTKRHFNDIRPNLFISSELGSLTSYAYTQKWNGIVLVGDMKHKNIKRLAKEYEKNGFHVFDLSKITKVPDSEVKAFWKIDEAQLVPIAFEKLFSVICANNKDVMAQFPTEIWRLLVLRRLGAWRYPEGEYFVNLVTPSKGAELTHKIKCSLLLLTSIPLPVEKLWELYSLIDSVILEQSTIIMQDTEWRKIVEEQAHSLRHTFGHLVLAMKSINNFDRKSEDLRRLTAKPLIIVEQIQKTSDFNLILMRFSHLNRLEMLNKLREDGSHQSVKLEAVRLDEMLLAVLEELSLTINSIGFSADGHSDKVLQDCIPSLTNKIKEDPALKIDLKVIKMGLRIVITDLLKNALFYTYYREPEVGISLTERLEGYFLTFKNNVRMEDNFFESIKAGTDASGVAVTQKAGIRTIRRIIKFPLFNEAARESETGGLWQLHVDRSSEGSNNWTELSFIIPKTDVVNGQD